MTVTHRKRQTQPDEIQSACFCPCSPSPASRLLLCPCAISHASFYVTPSSLLPPRLPAICVIHRRHEYTAVNEPGLQIQCDACLCDLTHSVRIKCADPICEPGDGVDICPACFCAGKEFAKHKRGHAYRVIELHSYPIFTADWGADEELLLLEGIALQGIGNWQSIAEHVGTRTREDVEKHYNTVYVDSPEWPLPKSDPLPDIDPADFLERKRRRISTLHTLPPPPKVAPTSAPGVHEVATFLPGRLEFEHELDNDAEDLVKDLEFGVCHAWGGDAIVEDELDADVLARAKMAEERRGMSVTPVPGVNGVNGVNGLANGHLTNGEIKRDPSPVKPEEPLLNDDPNADEATQPPPFETQSSLEFKLTLLAMYNQRVDKRHEAKGVMFERGLLEYKKMQAAEKKRPKDEKEILQRLRPFARLQTAEDYEAFSTDILYEAMLRKRIQDLQHYRRMGLLTPGDIDKYEVDFQRRQQAKANLTRDYYSSERLSQLRGGRDSHERESTPKLNTATNTAPRKQPAPLNLANSPSLHLLTPGEQTLCSQLRILPKPYLVIKETLVREYARRGGKLRRREARDLVKIDVNKTARVWDFLVQMGFLKILPDAVSAPAPVSAASAGGGGAGAGAGASANANAAGGAEHSAMSLSASPSKDFLRVSPMAFGSTSPKARPTPGPT
ncbi:hypothetical protein CONPUDRAFT_53341 [Coniophora puteana RWD-64-598 SS2]|uniref:Transcriptional adapter 2 n=1 Tax=Coniophora puteana (strain RWD-64-598) TaxID=741705 RepID=A0A5M3MWU2_CONPW|nr:uncharacterized protein CONPUDRAFT_53341 [Coniophora puteana RWD-64-598 SS2]EIW83540.1 hypothetical protein CONPUDRAFT_53341 [Coniophora puteana RWD-64-598 SS2]